ncbi:MAG TPA: DUF6690 family protein [Lacipirellulaceae bacterium]|nr:DUF6690 family protein [Lacipirellulaceae bacterium]
MSSRPLIIATLVGASVGVPYLASQSSLGQKNSTGAKQAQPAALPSTTATPSRTPIISQPQLAAVQAPVALTHGNLPPITGPQFASVGQVLRFDITKEWIYQNWDRKLTGPTDVGLFSVRVPLVMGPQLTALAGSLTYYFNPQGQVEYISFLGHTGDTTPLVQLVTGTYHLQYVSSPTGEQVYQLLYEGQVQSELRTHPEPILQAGSPNQSIAVELELARPGSVRVLPPRPTGFEAPQMAGTNTTSAPATTATNSTAAGSNSTPPATTSGSYFNKVRHATPQEESQVLWKRWPN